MWTLRVPRGDVCILPTTLSRDRFVPPVVHLLAIFKKLLSCILIGLPCLAVADVVPSALFRDHAVLQRDRPLPVWGTAQPGEKIHVTLGETKGSTTADNYGRWVVTLPAQPVSTHAITLSIEGSDTTLVYRDILLGDVWLCGGQSNMQMAVKNSDGDPGEINPADFPDLRHFRVSPNFPTQPAAAASGQWTVATRDSTGDFSAVAFFFARDVHLKTGIPIGLISVSYGNTPIATWRSASAVAEEPAAQQWWKLQEKSPTPPRPHRRPSAGYQGMIAPLLPLSVRGVLWYQGESDATEATTLAPAYGRQFTALIQEWRRDLDQSDLPFFWVQLAGYGQAGNRAWVDVRAYQDSALQLPLTGQATAIDLGDPTDIHPKRKREVGERLARLALNRVYAQPTSDSGPILQTVTRQGDALELHFSSAEGGLDLQDNAEAAFELAGADGSFIPATEVRPIGDPKSSRSLRVRAHSLLHPCAVRYAWHAFPHTPLYNRAGLPATPFTRELSKR
ncbi:MAG TPA: sialate O-acetylesterase [Opitutaceae bacterium]|nr:sialate O-acetylesterase [Opitutaceae bacterium]